MGYDWRNLATGVGFEKVKYLVTQTLPCPTPNQEKLTANGTITLKETLYSGMEKGCVAAMSLMVWE